MPSLFKLTVSLQDGVWNGTTILPPGWVNFTRTPSEASADFDCGPVSRVVGNCGPYGALWWLRPFRNVANDTYAAIGFEGQYIVLIPSQDLVIVALGWAVDDSMDDRYAGALVRNVSAAMSPRGTVLDARGV